MLALDADLHLGLELAREDQAEIAQFLMPGADDVLHLLRTLLHRTAGMDLRRDLGPLGGHAGEALRAGALVRQEADEFLQEDPLRVIRDLLVLDQQARLREQIHPGPMEDLDLPAHGGRQFQRVMRGQGGELVRDGDDRIDAVRPGDLAIGAQLLGCEFGIADLGLDQGRPAAAAILDDQYPVGTVVLAAVIGELDFGKYPKPRARSRTLPQRGHQRPPEFRDMRKTGEKDRKRTAFLRGIGQNRKQPRRFAFLEECRPLHENARS